MLYMLLVMGGVAVLLLPGWIDRYMSGLPDAPHCPGCRSVTRGEAAPDLIAALLPVLAATVFRECTACGWRGRMRLRLAPENAPGG